MANETLARFIADGDNLVFEIVRVERLDPIGHLQNMRNPFLLELFEVRSRLNVSKKKLLTDLVH